MILTLVRKHANMGLLGDGGAGNPAPRTAAGARGSGLPAPSRSESGLVVRRAWLRVTDGEGWRGVPGYVALVEGVVQGYISRCGIGLRSGSDAGLRSEIRA